MKFSRKTKISSEIPTSSMPDIIFMLLIFFMVTTVLREYSGLPVNIPKAEKIEKLKGKRHTAHIWVSKEGLISINDRLFAVEDVAKIMYDKRVSDPQVIVSLKAGLTGWKHWAWQIGGGILFFIVFEYLINFIGLTMIPW